MKINTSGSSSEGTTWSETNGYYWECVISGYSGITINTSDITSKISSSSSATDSIKNSKKHLVSLCSQDRTEKSNKKVKAKFAFKEGTDANNWKERLFGPEQTAPAA